MSKNALKTIDIEPIARPFLHFNTRSNYRLNVIKIMKKIFGGMKKTTIFAASCFGDFDCMKKATSLLLYFQHQYQI